MKTEMKKNKNALFAMMVVAALAMVSVAGIALQSDDADAAVLYVPIGDGASNPTIIGDTSVDATFYLNIVNDWGVGYVTIQEGITVSGTISVGTADSTGANYVEYGLINLNGVSNTVFTILFLNFESTGPVVIILAGDEYVYDSVAGEISDYKEATGSIELINGILAAGAIRSEFGSTMGWGPLMDAFDTATSFNAVLAAVQGIYGLNEAGKVAQYSGSFAVGNSTVSLDYMMGLIIGVRDEGKMAISGDVSSNDFYIPSDNAGDPIVDREDRFMIFESGEFTVAYADAFNNMLLNKGIVDDIILNTRDINTVIEDGVYVAVGENIPLLATVEIKILDSGTSTVFIQDVDTGKIIEAVATGSQDSDNYYLYEVYNAKIGQEYNLFILYNDQAYYGQILIMENGVTFYGNDLTPADISSDLTPVGNMITYSTSVFSELVSAVGHDGSEYSNLTSTAVGTSTDRQIDVTGMTDVYLVFRQYAAGRATVAYFGPANMSDPSTDVLANSEVKAGDVRPVDARTVYRISNIAPSETVGVLTIRGTLEFLFESVTSPVIRGEAEFNNVKIAIEDEGMMIYGVVPRNSPSPPMPTSTVDMAAAYFFVNEGSPMATKSTFYYTTLEKAITMSNTITITGVYTILENITLVSNDGSNLTIYIDTGATLNVGRQADPANDIEAAAPTVTIPGTTKVNRTGSAIYDIVKGRAEYDVNPTVQNQPESDVFISGDKFIYTDIATGLNISVSGDVLTLLRNATLSDSAEIKSGVELFDTITFGLTIANNVILNVNGKFTSIGLLNIDGTLRVNGEVIIKNSTSSPITAATTTFGASGVIDITSSGVLTISNNCMIIGGDGIGGIYVAGKIDLRNSSDVSAATIHISGEALVNGSAFLTAFNALFIGATPELSTGYTNTASITGIINLTSDAMVYAYGNFVVSDAGSNQNVRFATGTMLSTAYMIGDNLYVTVYATGGSIPMLFENQLLDIKIINWWNDRQLRNLNLRTATPSPVFGNSDWSTVYAEFEYIMYDVKFSYLQGMTWVVNGENLSGGLTKSFRYGESITVSGVVQPGFEGTPALRLNGSSYTGATLIVGSIDVPNNSEFTATGVQQASGGGGDDGNGGMTLIEYLLIVIVVIIAVIAIIVAIRLLRS